MNAVQPPYAYSAMAHLRKTDSVMAEIIGRVGPITFAPRTAHFESLAHIIVCQQLAGQAARAIFDRFLGLFPEGRFPTPGRLLAVRNIRLRRAGLSERKIEYLKDLARHFKEGLIDFRRFPAMEDDEVAAELTRIKGVGQWTADIFLMFDLMRPDVLPVGDLSLRNAVRLAYDIKRPVEPEDLTTRAEPWRPYRSAAAWYLWRSLRVELPEPRRNGARATEKMARANRSRH